MVDTELVTIAVDRQTGEELWRRGVPRDRVERIDPRNHPAAATPAIDGEHIYVFFAEIGLLAYDLDGNELWRLALGPFDNLYGMGASPVVHGGVVYLVCDHRAGSFLIAVDGHTGEIVWRVDRPEAASSHATPIVWQPPTGDPQLLVVGSFLFSGYSMATGERLWWIRGMIHEMKSVPVIADGIAYVNGYGSPLNDPGNTVAIEPFEEVLDAFDRNGNGKLSGEELPTGSRAHARLSMSDLDQDGHLDARDWEYFRNSMAMTNGMFGLRLGGKGDTTAGSFLWRYSRSVPQLPSPLLYRGTLYMINDGGIVTSIDPDTGRSLHQGRLLGAVDSYYASPIAADGRIYFSSEGGILSVVMANANFDILAVNSLGEPIYATPAISDDSIYVRTATALYRFGSGTTEER